MKTILLKLFISLFVFISLNSNSQSKELMIKEKNKKKGVVLDKKTIIPFKYQEIKFSGEFILTQNSSKTWQVFDQNGNILINKRKGSTIEIVYDTLFKVESSSSGKWQLYEKNGEKFLKGSYESIDTYENIILCEGSTYTEVFNLNGEQITRAFDIVYENELFFLYQDAYTSILDKKGKFIVPEKTYEDIKYNEECKCLKVQAEDPNFEFTTKKGKKIKIGSTNYGFVDLDGNIIIPCSFEDCKYDPEKEQWLVKPQKTVAGEKITWQPYKTGS